MFFKYTPGCRPKQEPLEDREYALFFFLHQDIMKVKSINWERPIFDFYIINEAATSILVQVFSWAYVSIFLGKDFLRGISAPYIRLVLCKTVKMFPK